MVSFVWFDIGYTLLYMQRETTYAEALRRFGHEVPLEAIRRAFHLTDKRFMREHPGVFLKPREVYMPWYLGEMNHGLGVSVDVCALDACWEEIKRTVRPYWLPYPEAPAVLERLRAAGLGCGVISNWDASAREVLRTAGLIGYFEPIVISSEVGVSKPDPAIFRLALAAVGEEPGRCLYVGDNYYDDALGGRRAGMEVLIVNRYGRLGVEEITDCPIIADLNAVVDHVARRNGAAAAAG